MATTGALSICRVCKELLVNGLCPNQHTTNDYKSNKNWPPWITRPLPIVAQERNQLEEVPKVYDEEDHRAVRVRFMHDINTAYELMEDETILELMYDVSILMQRALIHKRGPETLAKMVSMAKHMAKMAEATETYIRECRISRL